MAGGHVLLHGGVLAIAAGAQMRGDALALGEDLDRPAGETDLDGIAREAIGHAVIMPVDVDVIVDADPAGAPLGEHIGLDRQRLQRGAVEVFEELTPRHPKPPDRPLIVDLLRHSIARAGKTTRPLTAAVLPTLSRCAPCL